MWTGRIFNSSSSMVLYVWNILYYRNNKKLWMLIPKYTLAGEL